MGAIPAATGVLWGQLAPRPPLFPVLATGVFIVFCFPSAPNLTGAGSLPDVSVAPESRAPHPTRHISDNNTSGNIVRWPLLYLCSADDILYIDMIRESQHERLKYSMGPYQCREFQDKGPI